MAFCYKAEKVEMPINRFTLLNFVTRKKKQLERSFKVFFSKWVRTYLLTFTKRMFEENLTTAQKIADLITFTEEILNGKLHFLCIVRFGQVYKKSIIQDKICK